MSMQDILVLGLLGAIIAGFIYVNFIFNRKDKN